MPEGLLQLEHLMQATKLLQLKKVGTASSPSLTSHRLLWVTSKFFLMSAGFFRRHRFKSSSRNTITPTMKHPSRRTSSKLLLPVSDQRIRMISFSCKRSRMRLDHIRSLHHETSQVSRPVSSFSVPLSFSIADERRRACVAERSSYQEARNFCCLRAGHRLCKVSGAMQNAIVSKIGLQPAY